MLGIYRIINTDNQKQYIGSSNDVERRWDEHRKELRGDRHHSVYLQRSWNKHGEDVFKFELLHPIYRKEYLIAVEQMYLDNINPEYNIAKYASSGMRGRKHTKKTLERISKSKLGQKSVLTEEQVVQIRKMYATGNYRQREIGEEFGISTGHASTIIRGELWPHVGGPRTFARKPLTEEDVVRIRKKYASREWMYGQIAENYSLSPEKIKKVLTGEMYSEAGGPFCEPRGTQGEEVYCAKVTKDQVIEIRQKYMTGEFTQKGLGDQYGISESAVQQIVNGHNWKSAGGPIKGVDY